MTPTNQPARAHIDLVRTRWAGSCAPSRALISVAGSPPGV